MHLTKMRCATSSLGISAGNRFSITSSSSCRGYNKNSAFCKSTETFAIHYHNKHHAMYITCLLQGEHKVFPWLQTLRENYLNMLQLYVAPQLEEFQPWIIFQQDGAPPHCGSDVCWLLDVAFPNRWIGRDGPTRWPPRSPDITPLLTSFYWGMLRTKCFWHQFQILQIWRQE